MDRTIDRDRWQRISTILDAVLELPAADRDRYLDSACAGDAPLRRVVEELLAANAASGTFLSVPAAERAAALVAAVDGAPVRPFAHLRGRTIGAYRIVGELGEGGMGIVCLAERVDGHFEQRVAVKLVKHGLYSEESRQRFLQERRILAHLEHPAIARLLDGGVTPDGMPYFVMELVNGQPVTTYCAQRSLPTDERLNVFLQICDAVQYAHRNLIVHRDLKPSNILVDDSGRVKLLDFGIAKLLADDDDAAAAPQTMGRALTPEYAAPEQLLGEPVSTTTDVYALGVLLYELLTGERPYRLRTAAPGEIERAILEQEPLAPSSRVAGREIGRRLRGDLDRIVLKALQKSPDKRYPSAEAIAADVRRHQNGLPVSAQGDAISYRARKFFGRHRVVVSGAALLLLTLVGGLVATTWEARRAEREARKADAVKKFLTTLFSAADPERTAGHEPSVRQLLDAGAARLDSELQSQPDVQFEVTQVIGSAYEALGEYDRAAALYRAELARRRTVDGPRSLSAAAMLKGIADALYEQDRFDESAAMYDEALAIERERRGDRTDQVAELLWDIAGVARNRGDLARAESLEQQALAIYAERHGGDSLEAAALRESLAITYSQAGRLRDAVTAQAPVAALLERRLGTDHPDTLNAQYNVAFLLNETGRFEEAIPIAEDVVARERRVLGPRHQRLAIALRLLARARDAAGHAEDALQPIAEALRIQTDQLGPGHLQVAMSRAWQATIEMHAGRLDEAGRDARTALAVLDSYKGPVRADLPHVRTLIGQVLAEAGRLEEADGQIARAAADFRAAHNENFRLGLALDALADVALRRNQPARARDMAAQAMPLLDRNLDPPHPAPALACLHAGAAQWATGDIEAGERLMRDGLARLEARFPGGHPDVAAARLVLAGALAQKPGGEGRALMQKTLDWREAHFGPADPRTVAVRQALRTTAR